MNKISFDNTNRKCFGFENIVFVQTIDLWEEPQEKTMEIYDHLKANVLVLTKTGKFCRLSVAPQRYFEVAVGERKGCVSLDISDIVFQFLKEEYYKGENISVEDIAIKSIIFYINEIDEIEDINLVNPLCILQAMLLKGRLGCIDNRTTDKFNVSDYIENPYEYTATGLWEEEVKEIVRQIETDDLVN